MISFGENEILRNTTTGKDQRVNFIVYELAENGTLADLIPFPLSPELTRYFYHQLIDALTHLQEMGISHLDIKPSNLVLDKHWNLKLIDFGFSTSEVRQNGHQIGT